MHFIHHSAATIFGHDSYHLMYGIQTQGVDNRFSVYRVDFATIFDPLPQYILLMFALHRKMLKIK